MAYVLLVEADKSLADSLANNLSQRRGIPVRVTNSFTDAERLYREHQNAFSCAVFDLDAADYDHDKTVELVATFGIPTIAVTSDYSRHLKDSILSLQIVDYFSKLNLNEVDQVTALVAQLHHNRNVRVLVVDSSSSFQRYLTQLLRKYQFQVFTASSAMHALQWVDNRQSKPMDIIIVENELDDSSGCKLVSQLRIRLQREDVAIIGIASRENPMDAVKMFKAGVNDFIGKPFLQEEFACRIGQTMDMLKNIRAVKSYSTRDFLTNLYNRRYLMELGETLHAAARRQSITLQCFFVEITNFQDINQRLGYHHGDIILQQFAKLLLDAFRSSDIITRYGGEEFCIITLGLDVEQINQYKQRLIDRVSEESFGIEYEKVPLSISVSASDQLGKSFSELLNNAYQRLLQTPTH